MGCCHYYDLSYPLAENTKVAVLDNRWMPLASFARAIRVPEDEIKEKFPNLRVHKDWKVLVDLESDARTILTSFWQSPMTIEAAMTLFKSYCVPRKGDPERQPPAAAADAASAAKRETTADEFKALMDEYGKQCRDYMEQIRLAREEDILSTLMKSPEFIERIKKYAKAQKDSVKARLMADFNIQREKWRKAKYVEAASKFALDQVRALDEEKRRPIAGVDLTKLRAFSINVFDASESAQKKQKKQ